MIEKPPVKFIPAACYYKGRGGYKPVAIVCHIMQGTLAGTDSWFQNPNSQASTHFGIGKNGEIHQYVHEDDTPWANGVVEDGATWSGLKRYPGVNPNRLTFSIEFEGAHPTNSSGQIVPSWVPTEAQIKAAAQLIAYLSCKYNIPLSRDTVIGHSHISPKSKPFCPGPNFPYDRLIEEAKKILAKEAEKPMFTDIKGHWAEKIIEEVAQRKTPDGDPVLAGVKQSDGTYKFFPDEPLTRAQAAVIVKRLLSIIDSKSK